MKKIIILMLLTAAVMAFSSCADNKAADMTDSDAQAVASAIKAGNNLILCPADIEATVEAIKIGIAGGEISQQQIESSVTKILALKLKYGILDTATPKPETNTGANGTTAQ